MSVKVKDQHKVFVAKAELTSRGILPSSQELYDLMHITTCDHAIKRWKEHWMFCPVCLSMMDNDDMITHKPRSEILS